MNYRISACYNCEEESESIGDTFIDQFPETCHCELKEHLVSKNALRK